MTTTWRRGILRGDAGATAPVVVKVGGSLLARAGWSGDVEAVLAALPGPRLLVVGGGPLVDGLRAIDRCEPQPADLTHRLAIACMGLTARVVAATLAVPLVEEACPEAPLGPVLDVPAWLGRAGRLDRLPVGWHVTSDSIAAVVAAELGAALLLAKSVPPPHDDLDALAAVGWVDGFFPEAARPLSHIGWAAPA